MEPNYYKETNYWKKYLSFLPREYQDSYAPPEEAYWDWNGNKIHYDFKTAEKNKVTVILIHGMGGNGRILSIFGSSLFKNNINYYAPDNLGYGLTKPLNKKFDYKDWVKMMSDFTRYVIDKNKKPVILIGMSVGGMLAYQVACEIQDVRGIIVTTLADPRDEETMISMSKNKLIGKYALALIKKIWFLTDNIRLPIKWLCKIHLMSGNLMLSKIFVDDVHAGGIIVSMRFLRSFAMFKPAKEFDKFNTCPILLIHPEKDKWTPFKLSKKVFDKIKVKKELHLLTSCEHAPIETPGIYEMEKHILNFIEKESYRTN